MQTYIHAYSHLRVKDAKHKHTTYTHTLTHTRTYTYTCIRMHTYIHTYIHTYTYTIPIASAVRPLSSSAVILFPVWDNPAISPGVIKGFFKVGCIHRYSKSYENNDKKGRGFHGCKGIMSEWVREWVSEFLLSRSAHALPGQKQQTYFIGILYIIKWLHVSHFRPKLEPLGHPIILYLVKLPNNSIYFMMFPYNFGLLTWSFRIHTHVEMATLMSLLTHLPLTHLRTYALTHFLVPSRARVTRLLNQTLHLRGL